MKGGGDPFLRVVTLSRKSERDRRAASLGILSSEAFTENSQDVEATELLGKQFICPETGRAFNLQLAEITFHKKNNIPLPTLHCRRLEKLVAKRTLALAIRESVSVHANLRSAANHGASCPLRGRPFVLKGA